MWSRDRTLDYSFIGEMRRHPIDLVLSGWWPGVEEGDVVTLFVAEGGELRLQRLPEGDSSYKDVREAELVEYS